MNTYLLIGLPVLLAFISCFGVIPVVIHWVTKKGLLAQPNHRTSHVLPTPSMGGIGIFFGFVMVLPFLTYSPEIIALIIGVTILFFVGFVDDCIDMKSALKFALQLLCAFIVYWGGFKVTNLHGILGVNELAEFASFIITILLIVGITNAFNLIDGINGLAGGVSFINAFFFGVIFVMNGQINFALIAFVICGSLLAFLKYNFTPAKIFMGDTGSLFLGLLMSVFMIKTFQTNMNNEFSVETAIVLVFLPVFDTIRLFFQRILNKKSPFLADKNHLHHLVLKLFPNHTHATLLILGIHSGLLSFIFLKEYLNSKELLTVLLLALLVITSLFLVLIVLLVTRKKIKNLNQSMRKIVSENQLLEKL